MGLLDEAIAAHGGMERFEATQEISLRGAASGPAFTMKGQRGALATLDARVFLHRPEVHFRDWPRPGSVGVFSGWDARIDGAERHGRRQRMRWDELDVLHFAGYAMWNYLTVPFLLAAPGFEIEELAGRRLRVRFPPEIPTHSREQIVHLDEVGRVARLDYTAEMMGPWAKAANLCSAYDVRDGLVLAVRRRVVPRGPRGRALPGPTLVSIAFDVGGRGSASGAAA